MKEGALANLTTGIGDSKNKQSESDREIEGLFIAKGRENLNTLLQIDEGHIEAEDIAWETRHVAKPVARVGNGQDPVEDK